MESEVQLERKTITTVSLLVDISLRVILKFVLDKPRLFATIFLFHQVILDRNFELIMTLFVGHTAYLPPVMLQKVSQSVMAINAVLRCHRDSRDHFKILNDKAKTSRQDKQDKHKGHCVTVLLLSVVKFIHYQSMSSGAVENQTTHKRVSGTYLGL